MATTSWSGPVANTYRVNWAKQDLIIQSPLSKGEFGHLLALSGSTQDQAGRVIAIFHPPASLPDSYGHWTNFFEKVKRETPDALAHVGYTMFETDRIAPTWVEACKSVDEIWVPTEFNRRTFTGSGVDPSSIHVIPLGIDASKYEGAEPARLSDAAGFNFLSVFEWSKRKGYDLLLRAYAESFTRDDDVALFIRTYRYPASGSAQPDFSQLFERFCPDPVRAPKVVLLLNDLDDQAMASLYAACQAFVLPSRGEGWGIPYMEAMVSGLPTIGTRWSGNLEFMNDDNSFLIDIEGLTEIPNGDPEYPDVYWGHRMAAPSLEHLKRLMRFVYEHPAEAQQRGKQARRDMATLWTKENVAHKVTERLTELAVRGQAARQPPDKGIGHRSAASSLLRRSAPICGSRADPPPNHRPLRWAGPAFQSGDYGCELRDLAGALSSWPGVVRLEDLAWGLEQTLPRPTQFKLLLELMDQSIAEDADWIRVWHCPPTFFRVEEGANVSIGRASCETDSLPEDWLASCDRVDQLWLPSQFHVDCFAQAGVSRDKLRILPECIDSEQY
ncbi:MAG: glycosyltransferase family 4 protein, partial [Chloroflexota bacterium]|nr:glycosyltransferase family 4 protein [Chloroflexota bacterium]